MGEWKKRAAEAKEFVHFLKSSLSLFNRADDPDELARSLSNGNIEEVLEQTDMTESELAEQVEEIEEFGREALTNHDVRGAVETQRWGNGDDGH